MIDTKSAGDLAILKAAVPDEVADLVLEFGGAMTWRTTATGLSHAITNLEAVRSQSCSPHSAK